VTVEQPTGAEVRSWFEGLSNWGRWGADDERGTLNLITDEHRVAAARLVVTGRTVSCARPIVTTHGDPASNAQLFWVVTGEAACHSHEALPPTRRGTGNMGSASEYVGLVFHGFHCTHVDSQAHLFWEGRLYNDRPSFLTSAEFGSLWCPVTQMADGVVGRGVLLDVARAHGVDALEPGHAVTPEELAATAGAEGVDVGAGDIVLLRTGRWHDTQVARVPTRAGGSSRDPGPMCGWHPACMPWLHERDVAMIGCDYAQEPSSVSFPELPGAVHVLGLVAMGMPLIDNCDFEALGAACSELGRWEFQFVMAPLRVEGGSGSPVNPLAVL
jgi:kynurenine formamidase